HGRSSRQILDPSRILSAIGLKEGETFLDAGAGDGYMSIAASSIVGENGKVYAVDIYEESMNTLKNEIKNKKIENIIPIIADITKKIPIEDEIVDKCYMANVLHGFVENDEVNEVMTEINRIIKPNGTFNVIEFKKIENTPGPPMHVRLNPEDVKNIIENHNLNVKSIEEVGKYHYAVIATKK
ncbi:MAG: class I SAM-dependent methyltransferase, partial [Methanobacterium sp.]